MLVGALREGHAALEAVVVDGLLFGGGGVVGLGPLVDGVGAILPHRDVLGLVQLELRAGHRHAGVIDLLHPQAVLHVGQIKARRELAAEVGAFDAGRVVHRGVAKRACRGVVDGHGVLGLAGRGVLPRHHERVLGDVTRQVAERRLVEARRAGREDRGVAVLLGVVGRLDGTGHRVVFAEGVAVEAVALDGKPVGVLIDVLGGAQVTVAKNHGKRQAAVQRLAVVIGDPRQVVLGRDGLRCGHVAAVDPLAVDGNAVVVGILDGIALGVHALVRRDERAARDEDVRVLGLGIVQAELLVSRREARAVAHRRGDLPQDVVLAVVGGVLVVKRDGRAVGLDELEGSRVARGARGQKVVLGVVVVLVCAEERELRARDGVAVLVGLLDLGDGLLGEVELELHVGGVGTALEVEELERVVRARLVGVAVPACGALPTRGTVEGPQAAHAGAVDLDVTGVEVDVQGRAVMDAAQISHQDAVDVDPDVIVAGKLVRHVLSLAVVDHLAIPGLGELSLHGEAKVMVQRAIGVAVDVLLRKRAPRHHAEDVPRRVEGEELAVDVSASPALLDAPGVVDVKGVGLFVVGGKVLGAVVAEVAVLGAQEAHDVVVGGLAGLGAGVKQVGKGLGAGADLRVAVGKSL